MMSKGLSSISALRFSPLLLAFFMGLSLARAGANLKLNKDDCQGELVPAHEGSTFPSSEAPKTPRPPRHQIDSAEIADQGGLADALREWFGDLQIPLVFYP